MRYLISGGGTGGHIYPAIAIAEALKAAEPEAEFLFVGALGRMEMERIPKAGYQIEGLWISGLQRGKILANLSLPFKLIHSLWTSWRILRRFRPEVVIGVGGYASAALLKMAQWMGYPSLLHEQNSFAGLTNRKLAKQANTICVAYPNMQRFFPSEKLVLTGNPVRQALLQKQERSQAALAFGLSPEKKTLLLIGGSLGARSLNQALAAACPELAKRSDIQVLWQTGKGYIEEYKGLESQSVRVLPFVEDMGLAYSLADLVVSRAGALSVSELCLLAKAAVLIPSPNVADDHQTANAKALAEAGAARLLCDSESKEAFLPLVIELLEDDAQRKQLEEKIVAWAYPQAARHIAAEVQKLATQKNEKKRGSSEASKK